MSLLPSELRFTPESTFRAQLMMSSLLRDEEPMRVIGLVAARASSEGRAVCKGEDMSEVAWETGGGIVAAAAAVTEEEEACKCGTGGGWV